MWTIHDIEVMLWHFITPAPWPRGQTDAYTKSCLKLARHGLLTETFKATPRGCTFITMLQKTPVPVDGFCDPRVTENVA
jgi:hypothetical protein